ncbi:MAG: YdeI/OmpD-associated family protein [Candidatus Altiarchaeota archaeon]|nr:YdeI/OmpD-associated family protein [Candidatus Altiarchaeota archaeon]
MKLGKTLYASNRRAWRSWLAKHHSTEKEIWLVYPRKSSGKQRIPYNDAVEEALCYGWIDSNLKGIDDENYAQRFSPRKPTSRLSQMNKERIRKLIADKKMTAAGIAAIAKIFDPAKGKKEKLTISPDILPALKADKQAWKNFQKLPETYKRIRIAYIQSRKRHGKQMFQKSLQHFIKMTAKNKRFGFIRE